MLQFSKAKPISGKTLSARLDSFCLINSSAASYISHATLCSPPTTKACISSTSNVSDAMRVYSTNTIYVSDSEGVTVEVKWLVLAIKLIVENTFPSSEYSFNV